MFRPSPGENPASPLPRGVRGEAPAFCASHPHTLSRPQKDLSSSVSWDSFFSLPQTLFHDPHSPTLSRQRPRFRKLARKVSCQPQMGQDMGDPTWVLAKRELLLSKSSGIATINSVTSCVSVSPSVKWVNVSSNLIRLLHTCKARSTVPGAQDSRHTQEPSHSSPCVLKIR